MVFKEAISREGSARFSTAGIPMEYSLAAIARSGTRYRRRIPTEMGRSL